MFISFEGCEGSGKTTLSSMLFKKINLFKSVILTKEPGGSDFNLAISQILLNFHNQIDFHTEALLYAADRTEHLQKIILPALNSKKIVICDRYVDSSLAYQGYARGLGFDFIRQINLLALKNLPNLTFYLDLDPKIGLQRIKTKRQTKINSFDLQHLAFHNKVREGYLKIFSEMSTFRNICFIDAQQPLDIIRNQIETKIQKLLNIKL
ncbi:MAG: dTMP kinase [Vigna little leaf phytoplasma]|nr:dTMP kinase [Vigna little leaf phytoplasma]